MIQLQGRTGSPSYGWTALYIQYILVKSHSFCSHCSLLLLFNCMQSSCCLVCWMQNIQPTQEERASVQWVLSWCRCYSRYDVYMEHRKTLISLYTWLEQYSGLWSLSVTLRHPCESNSCNILTVEDGPTLVDGCIIFAAFSLSTLDLSSL